MGDNFVPQEMIADDGTTSALIHFSLPSGRSACCHKSKGYMTAETKSVTCRYCRETVEFQRQQADERCRRL